MVQIIPQQESYSQVLGSALGGGLSQGLGQAMSRMFEQKQRQQQLQGLAPIFEQLGLPKESIAQMIASGLDPQMAGNLALGLGKQQSSLRTQQAKSEAKDLELKNKQAVKQEEKFEKGKTFSTILDKMENLKPYVGTTKIPFTKSFLGQVPYTTAAQKRKQINTLRLSLEGLFRDLTTKGQFPKAIYERVLKELPNADDSEKEYQGHLDGVRDILHAHFGKQGSMSPGGSVAKSNDFVTMRDPQGNIRKIPKSSAIAAQKAGGVLIR